MARTKYGAMGVGVAPGIAPLRTVSMEVGAFLKSYLDQFNITIQTVGSPGPSRILPP